VYSEAYKVLARMNRAGHETEQGYNDHTLLSNLVFYELISSFVVLCLVLWLVVDGRLCILIFFLNCMTSYLILLNVWYLVNA
jgi:hypothetical protein